MPLLMGWATLPTSRDMNFLRQRSLGPRYQWLVPRGLHSRTAQGSGGLKTCVPNIVSGIDDCMYFRSSRNPLTAVLSSLEASNAHKSAQSSCL